MYYLLYSAVDNTHASMFIKLQEMNDQLDAIESTARKLEGDFKDSNQVVYNMPQWYVCDQRWAITWLFCIICFEINATKLHWICLKILATKKSYAHFNCFSKQWRKPISNVTNWVACSWRGRFISLPWINICLHNSKHYVYITVSKLERVAIMYHRWRSIVIYYKDQVSMHDQTCYDNSIKSS